MTEKKYTIKEIKKYLNSQDSFGDCLYNLNEENMDKTNEILSIHNYDEELILTIDLDYVDADIIINILTDYMDEEDIKLDIVGMSLSELLEELELTLSGGSSEKYL